MKCHMMLILHRYIVIKSKYGMCHTLCLTLVMMNILMHYTPTQSIMLSIPVVSMYFQSERKIVDPDQVASPEAS